MSTHLKGPKQCPTCGKTTPAGALAGLCPVCLLAQGVETDAHSDAPGPIRSKFEPPSVEAVARLFPQLEILGLLGAGGMGAVYKARQPVLDRWVALKVLPAGGAAGTDFAERFNREARALARLSHPNIVAVHEFGQVDSLHYFLMEFVDGTNLRQLEQAGRLSPREALQLVPQICDALQYAHDEGVVHRDIKPENVIVDRKGRVKIADFGLAKIMGQDPDSHRLTAEGQVMGTPHYMAPEQLERPLSVDHRADIYSLGVVFYELLTGDLPLGKFLPPSRKVQVDVRLDEIVLRALENDPARRYQQAGDVKSRVETVVGTPAAATAATMPDNQSPAAAPGSGVRYLCWLGIPAVVERHGEREVNLQGAIGVFFVMLMTSALVQQAVRWGTGSEHAMVQLSFLTAAMMAIWALRRTMNQPAKEAPVRRAGNGTVILSPSPRRRYIVDGLMVVGLVVFVVGSHYLKTRISNPRFAKSSVASAAQVVHWNPASGTSLVRHPEGGTAELLGISDPDSATNGWWRADGTAQSHFTLGVRDVELPLATNVQLKNFVLQFEGLDRDAVEQIEFESATTSSGLSGADEVIYDGKPLVTDARRYLVSFPAGLTKTKIRIAWGTGDWQTVLSMAGPIWRESPQGGVSNSKWRLQFVGLPAKTGDDLQVSYLCDRRNPLGSHRLVAIDQQGREHSSQGGTGTGTGGGADQGMVFVMQFRGLELGDVKEFRLQTRLLQWAEFPEVALVPKMPLARREALRLTESVERSFDELIDFDTGQVAAFPSAKADANPLSGISNNLLWAQQNGFDAVASNGKLDILDVDFAPLDNADWDRLTAPEVLNRLHRGLFHPQTLKELRPGEFPTTYAYLTRERGYGMIQLVAFDPQRPGATVRLKRVQRPGTESASAFGPATLLAFDAWVDFDTGHAADFPPAEPGSNPFAGIGKNILWAQANGFDAVAGAGRLELLGATVAEISDAEWETMTPNQAEVRLAATGTNPREITPLNPDRGTSPAYAFRTAEGGVGLIRFVEFQRESSRFKVQFRHMTPSADAVRMIRARRDGKTGEQVGRLPGRGTVTLLALRSAGSTIWSRPDGTSATDVVPQFALDFDRTVPTATGTVAGRLWQVLFRAEHLPSPEDPLHFEFHGVINRFATGDAIVPQGGANPGMVSIRGFLPDSATNATMRISVPMTPWRPIRSFEPLSRSFTKSSWGNEPKWNIEMHAAGVGAKGAQITVVFGASYPAWNLRVVARRSGADDVLGLADASVTNGTATTSTYVFPSLTKLDDVQNFQVQAQPTEWVEFSNFILGPTKHRVQP